MTELEFKQPIDEQITSEDSRTIPYYKARRKAVRDVLSNNTKDVILYDGDADGLGAAALLDEYHTEEKTVAIPVGGSGHFLDVKSVFELLQYKKSVNRVFIVDYCLDEAPSSKYNMMKLLSPKIDFYLFDHHEWTDEDTIDFFETHCEHCELDVHIESEWEINGETIDERCTTQMIADYITDQGVDIPDAVQEKVRAVAVGDLWLVDDDEEYINPLAEPYGASADYLAFHTDPEPVNWFGFEEWVEWFTIPDTDLSDTLSKYAQIQAKREEEKLAYLEAHFDELVSTTEHNGKTVYSVYGNINPNVVAKHLRQNYEADVCFLVRPNGYCSMRGSEEYDDCDVICSNFNGGGHEKAGGFALENAIDDFDKEDYKDTNGIETREALLTVI